MVLGKSRQCITAEKVSFKATRNIQSDSAVTD